MKKIFDFCFIAALFILGSCGPKPEEQVKEFAVKFGDFVNTNKKDSIQKYYPEFQLSDSLATVALSNINVTPGEKDREYIIEYSPETKVFAKIDENRNISVIDSRGVLAFRQEKMELAKKTGLWNDEITDIELSKRIGDDEFFNFIANKVNFNPDKILTVGNKFIATGEDFDGQVTNGYYTITNNTNQTIYPSDYQMNFKDEYSYCDEEDNKIQKYSEDGKEIQPNSTIKIESTYLEYQCRYEEDHHLIDVTILLTPEEIQNRFITFTGNEYQEYLNSK